MKAPKLGILGTSVLVSQILAGCDTKPDTTHTSTPTTQQPSADSAPRQSTPSIHVRRGAGQVLAYVPQRPNSAPSNSDSFDEPGSPPQQAEVAPQGPVDSVATTPNSQDQIPPTHASQPAQPSVEPNADLPPGEVEVDDTQHHYGALLAGLDGAFKEVDFRKKVARELPQFKKCMDAAYQKVAGNQSLNSADVQCFERWYNACLPLAERFEQKNVCREGRKKLTDHMRAIAAQHVQKR